MGRREQLARVQAELSDARRRAHALARPLDALAWGRRPTPDRWSVADCLIHLNLTTRAFLPLIADALVAGRQRRAAADARYRMDLMGRLLWWGAATRLPVKTTEPFVPARGEPKDAVLGELDRLQDQLIAQVEEAVGLDLGRLRVVSPFDARITYNLYSCFRLIPAHQRLHLRQAERELAR